MNEQAFKKWMSAIDDDLLEEAKRPVKRRRFPVSWIAGAAAACLCLAVAGTVWQPGKETAPIESNQDVQVPNPIRVVTKEELADLGYPMPQPEGSKDVLYTAITQGDGAVPMAQVTFSKDDQEYTCRALKTDTEQDISGIYADWSETLEWVADTLRMKFRASDTGSWISWYSDEAQIQWCLSAYAADKLTLMSTAKEIVEELGYDVGVAPDGATDITYQALQLQDLTAAETAFVLDETRYVFRMANTTEIAEPFADISGDETVYAVNQSGEVGWCPARLSYDEGESGKIVWFDVVPGLLYSLTMDNGASEEALTEMAMQIFDPAQEGN